MMKNRRTGKRYLSILLAFVMLFTVPQIPVTAEAIGDTETIEDMETAGDTEMIGDTETAGDTETVEDTEIGGGGEIQPDRMPENPKYDAATGMAEWSYVYFGSYPQSEVTGDELTEEITGASYDANKDAWAGGNKYRRIRQGDTYRYFKWERIKWRVLNRDDSTLLLLADRAVDYKKYNNRLEECVWAQCALREWLNDGFFHMAFSGDEQNAIVFTEIADEPNPEYGAAADSTIGDTIYLPSIGDMAREEYGFCGDYGRESTGRKMAAGAYANAVRGTDGGDCRFLLRTNGRNTYYTALVDADGAVNCAGTYIDREAFGVVPMLRVDLSSECWKMTDDGGSGEGGGMEPATREMPANPVHHCALDSQNVPTSKDTTDWNYVYFGSYPQSEVTGYELTQAIKEAEYDINEDAWVDGFKYRRVADGGTYRYFKWERIKWRVLRRDNSTLFLMADTGLDCKKYNENAVSVPTWESSTIRAWLNENFYRTAFSESEQEAVLLQEVSNSVGSEKNNIASTPDTKDRVFLLSFYEATNEAYGLCKSYAESPGRAITPSDYTRAMGAVVGTEDLNPNTCHWRLRSTTDVWNATVVLGYKDGMSFPSPTQDGYACVPALCLDVSSDLRTMTDDKTSGEGGSYGNLTKDTPVNPVHICAGNTDETGNTDVTDWSYLYFGSYPQREITGEELTAKITKAAYNKSGDAWVDGIKYRRISKSDTKNEAEFGENKYRYFQWERIRWRVLNHDDTRLLVMADLGLDSLRYNETYASVLWEDCTLHTWLNETFYRTAFDESERGALIGGEKEKIRLLTREELSMPSYGFCEKDDGTYPAAVRRMRPSDYARAIGAVTDFEYGGSCRWWLGSSKKVSLANCVENAGTVATASVNADYRACAPVVSIDLSKELWQMKDDKTSGTGGGDNGAQEPATSVEDPQHHCTKDEDSTGDTDTTDWSYVYFGSYPQTEVKDGSLLSELRGADYDKNQDTWLNGIKYRRVGKGDVNNTEYFGDEDYRYFKWERIRWRVLKSGENELFLAADQGLDCKKYNERKINTTWEYCTLREWLNNDFYHTAFSESEQGAVIEQNLVNHDNPDYQTPGGNDTRDYVCLLSQQEASNPEYGFCESSYVPSASRRLSATDYAHVRGVSLSEVEGYEGGCFWILRSPGYKNCTVVSDHKGLLDLSGRNNTTDDQACVPVIRIDTDFELYFTEDDGSSGEGGGGGKVIKDAPGNPKYDAESDSAEWSCIYLGSYPQTEVKGEKLTAAITGASYDDDGNAWVGGIRYHRISRSDTTNPANFGSEEYRYFKWEKIRWRVLQNDGATLFVMADIGLDCQKYNKDKISVTWQDSTLREWLNDKFVDTAFGVREREAIVEWDVVNENNPDYNTPGGDDTRDRAYLLSAAERRNTSYGFGGKCRITPSDYAYAMGAYTDTGMSGADSHSMWWLRSSGSTRNMAAAVNEYGILSMDGITVDNSFSVCVPVMHIDLSSDRWKNAGEEEAEEENPVNPVHLCTIEEDQTGHTDATKWSYVYFGSYPQTEVAGEKLTAAIVNAEYDANGDAWVDGSKYRRITKEDTNSDLNFGDQKYRYFRWERIRWRVLQNDGSSLLLMADYGIDSKKYNDRDEANEWESSTIRAWLNDTFYRTAFDSLEQKAVLEWEVDNTSGSYNGNDTRDKVYLLSTGEAADPAWGFCGDEDHTSASRQLQLSDYAHAMGASLDSGFWLRTSMLTSKYIASLQNNGYISYTWASVDLSDYACAPILHLNLASNLWYMSDDETSGAGGGMVRENKNPCNPAHSCTKGEDTTGASDTTEWDYVYFGSYPQREVAGSELTSEIVAADYNKSGDAWVNGVKYRRIAKEDTNDGTYFGNDAYPYRYFRWERVRWRVLKNEGDTLFLMADEGLDCKDDNSARWEFSVLREWLNGTFYNMAFSTDEQSAIVTSHVIDEGNPHQNVAAGTATEDNVYLLSLQEVNNLEYGFCADEDTKSASRRIKPTDYAHAMGAQMCDNSYYQSVGNCGWWLRTLGAGTFTCAYVIDYGMGSSTGNYQYKGHNYACVPVLRVNRSSDLWYTEDDGTSGDGGGGVNYPPMKVWGSLVGRYVKAGASTTLTVSVRGGNPFEYTYQWYYAASSTQAGRAINGARQASYTISSFGAGNAGYYYCVISDGVYTVTSNRAQLLLSGGNTGGNNSGNTGGTNTGGNNSSGTNTGGSNNGGTKPSPTLPAFQLSVKLASYNSVKLSWKKVSGANRYQIYRSTSKMGTYKKIKTVKKNKFTNKKLKSKKTYYYRIVACYGDRAVAQSNISSKKVDGRPSTPKMKVTQDPAAQSITISWKPVKKAQWIEVLSVDGGGGTKVVKKFKANKKGKIVLYYSAMEVGVIYRYTLRSYYKKDGKKIESKVPKALKLQW